MSWLFLVLTDKPDFHYFTGCQTLADFQKQTNKQKQQIIDWLLANIGC